MVRLKNTYTYYYFQINFAVISQEFKAHVALETYVILGNDALVKCEIPSFVSDLVTINGWMDDENNDFFAQITGDYYDI